MYAPSSFEEARPSELQSLMRAYPFASLVAATPAGIDAEHIPMLFVETEDAFGTLQGHVARANPVWQRLSDDSEILAIFHGPNQYISPKWYPSKQKHGKVVPTWNYLIVHARGKIRWHHDPIWLRKHLEDATQIHEGSDNPWHVSDAPADFIDRLLEGIVGFEILISDLRGKWKLSQNRNLEDRLGVIAGLKNQANASAAEMAERMSNHEDSANVKF